MQLGLLFARKAIEVYASTPPDIRVIQCLVEKGVVVANEGSHRFRTVDLIALSHLKAHVKQRCDHGYAAYELPNCPEFNDVHMQSLH